MSVTTAVTKKPLAKMTDSGLSIAKLAMTTDPQPVVRMPEFSTTSAMSLQDSGICCDLLTRLNLSGDAPDVKEYFEPDDDGDVQLHLAVASGLADVVDALVRMAPTPDLLSIQNNQGYSPLHIAVLQSQPAFVRRLVVAGARIDLRDSEGNTPLHLTARRGNLDCAEALLRPVGVMEVGQRKSLVNQQLADVIDERNANGEHCVHLATMGGHVAYLQFLTWNGADMNALEGRAGRSALHLAVGAKSLQLVQCLVEPKPRGCGLNPDILDWHGRTAHQLSLINGQSDIAAFLGPRTPSSSLLQANYWLLDESDQEEEESFLISVAMILCVGAVGAGKSTLLKVLQMFGQECPEVMPPEEPPPGAAPPPAQNQAKKFPIPLTTPTVGTDLLSISRIPKSKTGNALPEQKTTVREIGGVMAPIWPSYVEPGRTRGILYVVDSSSPETIGASTVRLVELLAHPSLENISTMIVFSKSDLNRARQLHELKHLMRLDQIVSSGTQDVKEVAFNILKRDTLADIFEWCMKFQGPPSMDASM